MFPEGCDERWPPPHPAQRRAGSVTQLPEVLRAEVWQLVMFPVAPDVLCRIQLGGVCGQVFERDPATLGADVLAHEAATVRGEAVPDDQQLAGQMPLEVGEKLHDLRCLDRAGEEPEVKVPPGDAGDRRESLPVEVVLEDWRLPAGCPRPAPVGALAQPALVDEDDRLPLAGGVFFTAGHRRRFQRRIAASSRSKARPVGRWQLQPSCRRIRQTWPG